VDRYAFEADPDQTFHFDPNPTFHIDPDHTPSFTNVGKS
jgi:hypothetical protein